MNEQSPRSSTNASTIWINGCNSISMELNEANIESVDVFICSMWLFACDSCWLESANTCTAPAVQLGALEDEFVGHAWANVMKSGGSWQFRGRKEKQEKAREGKRRQENARERKRRKEKEREGKKSKTLRDGIVGGKNNTNSGGSSSANIRILEKIAPPHLVSWLFTLCLLTGVLCFISLRTTRNELKLKILSES